MRWGGEDRDRLVEVSNVFVLCDSQAVFEVQVLEDLSQLRHHTLDQFGVQAHRESNLDPQVVPCTEFGKYLCPQAVPHFWGDGAYETKGMLVGNGDGLGRGCSAWPRLWPWQRLGAWLGGRHWGRPWLHLDLERLGFGLRE